MKLRDLVKDLKDFTEKLSNVNRQIAFAGIAIIWIFRIEEGTSTSISKELILPIILLIAALAFDLIQFLFSSIAWKVYLWKKEQTTKSEDDFRVPSWISNISYFGFFFPKVIFTITAYSLLFINLGKELF